LELLTDPRALIPRPETEGLVELVLEWASTVGPGLSALDLGTGTGAIVLSLAREGPFDRLVATDVSDEALGLARENRDRLGLDGAVEFRRGATWDPIDDEERFHVVVSNPPYVTDSEMSALEPEVSEWEPEAALAGGHRGLDVLRPLIAGAPQHLEEGGLLAVELGAGQGEAVLELVRDTPGLRDARSKRDLAGRDRYVLANRENGSTR
jgi:release factor glutamine methyltransferase